jgi:hypothetical protein
MSAQPNKSILDQIEDVVKFYHGLPRDYNDIKRLQSVLRGLATLIFYYGQEVGALQKQKKRTEFAYKAAVMRERERLMKDENKSAAAAEVAAKEANLDLMDAEQQADAEHYAARIIYDSANGVLETMRQHIASMKTERDLEMKGGMVQQQ